MDDRELNLLRRMSETTWRFYVWTGGLLLVLGWGMFAYIHQIRDGLIVTGMRDEISWGLYITNFVFFIGISHAGTLISAILRVTNTGWRRPITRMAEAVTVFALCIGAPLVIIDMGRPDRLLNIFRYGRIQSPIVWDVLGVSTYLAGCVIYFYIPMIPDLALLAEQQQLQVWRRRLYKMLALGWTGAPEQKELLEKAISVMAVFIIPLAVSVHTVVSWIFAMTLRPGWDSSIFGPYFVVGAIYSGAAAVIFSMYVLRRIYHLEKYILLEHFRNLGLLLLSFSLLYLYFNINEYLTAGYKLEGVERSLLERLFQGDYAHLFWTAQSLCVFIPLLLLLAVLGFRRNREFTVPGVVMASAFVVVGAWAKRYIIIVPTLRSPFLPLGQRLPWEWTNYQPTWVEWSITAAACAAFLLIYTLMSKVFPIVSIWETREGEAAPEEQPDAQPMRWWRPGTVLPALALGFLLLSGLPAHAASARKLSRPKPVTISAEWKILPASVATEPTDATSELTKTPERVYWFAGRVFDPFDIFRTPGNAPKQKPVRPVALVATLRDSSGTPVSFKPVEFSLRASFGAISYGSRPTLGDGKAQLIINDRRYGTYPLDISFVGDSDLAPAHLQVPIDFGPRPAVSLPKAGMLITPYATSAIAAPFLLFYGSMWVAFLYAFGFLIMWKMRHGAAVAKKKGIAASAD